MIFAAHGRVPGTLHEQHHWASYDGNMLDQSLAFVAMQIEYEIAGSLHTGWEMQNGSLVWCLLASQGEVMRCVAVPEMLL